MPVTYCVAVKSELERSTSYAPLHVTYHDKHHGMFPKTDIDCYKRLIMETNEAGLNWGLILSKEKNFYNAFSAFNFDKVARYNDDDVQELLLNTGIIRSEKKIVAAIENAKRFVEIKKSHGSVRKWLLQQHPHPLKKWIVIFKNNFRFVGPSVTSEYLIGVGMLGGAHHHTCHRYKPARELFEKSLKTLAPR